MHDKPCDAERGIPPPPSYETDSYHQPPVVPSYVTTSHKQQQQQHRNNVDGVSVMGVAMQDMETIRMSHFLVCLGLVCWLLLLIDSVLSLCAKEYPKGTVEVILTVAIPCLGVLGVRQKERCYIGWLNCMNMFTTVWILVWTVILMIDLSFPSTFKYLHNLKISMVVIGCLMLFLDGLIFYYSFKIYTKLIGQQGVGGGGSVVVTTTNVAGSSGEPYHSPYGAADRGSPVVLGKTVGLAPTEEGGSHV
eukprot:GHVS01064382.1.p1 GENE.GHVS01064382.1~~GHVS01064382.1.p1  ORF type:complete len:248 (-),score=33.57 GHVS01064382.1:508-1251(-)